MTEQKPERLFCPNCGKSGVYDCTSEGDFVCADENCPTDKTHPFISPIREHNVLVTRLIQLTVENQWLRQALLDKK